MAPKLRCMLFGAATAVALGTAAFAQDRSAAEAEPANEVEPVVVKARRIGVPVWRVGNAASAIVFVGSIGDVPKDVAWRSEALEAAVAGSRKVLHSAALDVSLGDLYGILFKRGRWTDLPEGETLDARLDPVLRARLARLAAAGKLPRDYQRLRPWYAAIRLDRLASRADGLRGGASALDVARRTARRSRIPVQPVLRREFKAVITQAANQRSSDVACLDARTLAAEAGPVMVRERAQAWTRSRIPEVLASPETKAEGLCWPEGEAALGPELRRAWREAARRELAAPGAVVAVVPLRYLAEPGGLLDDLSAQGYAVEGPRWREDQP